MINKNKVFKDGDLKEQDFDGDIFDSCKFTKNVRFVNFTDCKFKTCDFSAAIYNIVNFSNCKFIDCKLSGIDFNDIGISQNTFENCVMENCVFQKKKKFILKTNRFINTNLSKSAFVFCDVSKMSFENCDLTSTIFERCDLTETNFSSTKVDGTGFENCKINKTILDVNGFISYGNSKGFVLTS